ncbi:MAG: ExbD/TolR family protein [Phycisphaerae bacterium]
MKAQLLPAVETTPNLAPMVDVIMVLLVFFLIGASFGAMREGMLQTTLDANVGPGGSAAIDVTPRIRIALRDADRGAAGEIIVMDQPIAQGDFSALRAFLEKRRQGGIDADNPVVLAAEPNVRWDFVVQAMDAAMRAGFRNVQFAVSAAVKG